MSKRNLRLKQKKKWALGAKARRAKAKADRAFEVMFQKALWDLAQKLPDRPLRRYKFDAAEFDAEIVPLIHAQQCGFLECNGPHGTSLVWTHAELNIHEAAPALQTA